MGSKVRAFLVAGLLAHSPVPEANVAVERPIDEKFQAADLIVIGNVQSVNSRRTTLIDRWRTRTEDGIQTRKDEIEFIITEFEIQVFEKYKTKQDFKSLTFVTKGGTLPDGTKQIYLQNVELEVGQEILVFLVWDDDNNWFTPRNGPVSVYSIQPGKLGEDSNRLNSNFHGLLLPDDRANPHFGLKTNGATKAEIISLLEKLQAEE